MFSNIIKYILNIAGAIRKMTLKSIIDQSDFFFKKQLLFNKISEKIDLQFFATKITEEIPDASSSKEYYNSYLN